jgi:hypothetical protein
MAFQLKRINKHLFYVAGVMLAGIGIVVALSWNALKVDEKEIDFERKASSIEPKLISITQRNKMIVDVAGITRQSLYFQTKSPATLLVTNKELKANRYLTLNIPASNKIGTLFFSSVDSPAINIVAGNAHSIISGNVNENLAVKVLPSKIFTRAARISLDSYIVRGFDSTTKTLDQIFMKIDAGAGKIQREKGVSEMRNDAGISTDGQLHFDEATKLVTFVHYYSNKIFCLDTNLNLMYTAKTFGSADANESVKMSISSKGEVTNATPKRTINKGSDTWNGLLFNQSKVYSKNDISSNRNSETVIDIYDIKTGLYKESFYIPSLKGQTIHKFRIYDNLLVALYKDYIATYQVSIQKK